MTRCSGIERSARCRCWRIPGRSVRRCSRFCPYGFTRIRNGRASGPRYQLTSTRRDIADYLGLAVEAVSRSAIASARARYRSLHRNNQRHILLMDRPQPAGFDRQN
ncbi:hypothetical protein [Bradyrhizobium sp. McL0616]|uniref:hypothetical protein n=1 Tax=Bradyrhizobium sp. McL0616 TaxID=3415674 RepID=UPI003CF16A7B